MIDKIDHIGVALALRPATFRHNAEDILRLNESLKRMAPRYPSLKLPIEILHGSLDDVVKLTIYLTDLDNFAAVNKVMAEYCDEPYPARAAVQVSALPKGVDVEADAILAI